jgi:hypothetical protein
MIARNLSRFLQDNVRPGQEADVAINKEMQAVLVFIDGELALTAAFEELMAGAGGSIN